MPKALHIEDISEEGIETYVSTDIDKYHKDTKAVNK